MRKLSLLFSILVVSETVLAQERLGETRLSLAEARTVWVVPSVKALRQDLKFGDSNLNPGSELATGVEMGARLISSSNRDRTLLIGLDLRQAFARVDGRSNFDVSSTRLGLNFEGRPRWKFEPGFSLAWFFGDTLVARHRDRQFNGNTLALAGSIKLGSARYFLELSGASYHEGPGFITLARQPGIETLDVRTLAVGAEFPIEIVSPSWLKWSEPEEPRP